MVIPDTNVWSELTKRSGNPAVLAWLQENNADLYLSVVVIAEIRAGIESPQAGKKRAHLEEWLAAQAMSRDCPIATHNVRDFEWTEMKVINPWDA